LSRSIQEDGERAARMYFEYAFVLEARNILHASALSIMGTRELHADCTRCIGLCCVALAFDCGPAFAFNKPANERCRHLLPVVQRCAIHEERDAHGMSGCVRYDCLGAGQRVTAMFARRERDDAMLEAFRKMKDAHASLALLIEAKKLPLDPASRSRCDELYACVDREAGRSTSMTPEVHSFLRTLEDLTRRALGARA
jgi:hypothetical protein